MKQEESLEYEQMKKNALEQLRSGKSLYGKDGAFAPLLKSFLDAALEAELESHLDEAERSSGNRRNGRTSKEVRTSDGTITVNTPRDRNSSFEPELIRKRETMLWFRVFLPVVRRMRWPAQDSGCYRRSSDLPIGN